MKIIENYVNRVQFAFELAKKGITDDKSLALLSEKKDALLSALEGHSYVKIPFVGDFSAGKSSLINAYLGLDSLLPTDITPETAVAYELWYSEGDCLEKWRDNKLIETYQIHQIGELDVRPGDTVKVFLNNPKLKELNERGIVLVDMPGIDSGIEEHTNAILKYIHQGTAFAVFTDIEEGTLRGTTISFIEELKKYGIEVAVFISKADKKPAEEQEKIKNTVSSIASRVVSKDVFVGVTSAHQSHFDDLDRWIGSIKAEDMLVKKFAAPVDAFVKSVSEEMELTIQLLQSDVIDYDSQLKEIEKKKEAALSELRKNAKESQPLEDSVKDILRDVEFALKASSSKLAVLLYGTKDDSLDVKAELMNIIRPVLIQGFNREMSEYQDYLDDGIQNFSVDVAEILSFVKAEDDKISSLTDFTKDILADILPAFDIPPVLADLIANKIAKYIPDVLRVVFGRSDEQVLSEIKQKLNMEMFPRILLELSPSIHDTLSKGRADVLARKEAEIEAETARYDASLKQVREEMAKDAEYRTARIQSLNEILTELNSKGE